MRKILMAPALALGLATAAGFAIASEDAPKVDVPKEQWMSLAEIAQKLETDGYDIREIEVEDGAYEVSAVDKDGKRLKAYLHPATGEVLKSRSDDD